jgi:hypothetical protein
MRSDVINSTERRLQDLESAQDHATHNGVIFDTKFDDEKKRWYVRHADKLPTAAGGEGQTATNVDTDPNFQSDWLPWATHSHGTITYVIPPRIGQRSTMHTHGGRPELGHCVAFHNNPDTPCPSGNPDEIRIQVKPPADNDPGVSADKGKKPDSTHDQITSATSDSRSVSRPSLDDPQSFSKTVHTADDHTLSTKNVTTKTDQSNVSEAAKDKITRNTGTNDPEAAAGGSAGGGNLPHELNAQLQGLRAEVTQHTHHIAALHDQMSSIIDLAMPKVPQLAALLPFLDHQPQGLEKAADGVLGKLEQYVSFSLQQAVAKLTNSFMGSVMSIAGGNISGQIGGALSHITGLAGASDAAVATAPNLQSAQTITSTLVPPAASSSSDGSGASSPPPTVDLSPLLTALEPIEAAFSGTASGDDVTGIVNDITALSPATAAGMVTVNSKMNDLATIYADNAGPGNLSVLIAAAMSDAAALSSDAFAIDPDALAATLAPVAPIFTGASAQGKVQGLLGQVSGIAGAASGFLSGLGGMTDAQQNITQGMTKSYRLGGYGA